MIEEKKRKNITENIWSGPDKANHISTAEDIEVKEYIIMIQDFKIDHNNYLKKKYTKIIFFNYAV